MLEAESRWLGAALSELPAEAFPLINLGSSTESFRRGSHPWIHDEVFGPLRHAPAADANTLARLELANRVMRETTRLHPAGVLSPREAARDVTVRGYRIPKGTLILWSAHLAGRDPRAWSEPLRFDERVP